MYRDENGVWDGQHPSFFAFGETDESKAIVKLQEWSLNKAIDR